MTDAEQAKRRKALPKAKKLQLDKQTLKDVTVKEDAEKIVGGGRLAISWDPDSGCA